MIRAFLALPVTISAELTSTIRHLKEDLRFERLRWVPAENMHLTIRFFGETDEELLDAMSVRIEQAFKRFPAGDFRITGLGLFDKRSDYKVLWAGLSDDGILQEIKDSADSALAELISIEEGRRFRPHLTLARMKRLRDPDGLRDIVRTYEGKDFGSYPADRLLMFQSILGESGPVYRPLKEFVFG